MSRFIAPRYIDGGVGYHQRYLLDCLQEHELAVKMRKKKNRLHIWSASMKNRRKLKEKTVVITPTVAVIFSSQMTFNSRCLTEINVSERLAFKV